MDIHFFPRTRRALLMGVALAALTFHCDVQALTYLVGSDGVCDYSTVQAAINGAASNPGPDSIHIANNASYTQQALTIGSQDLIIEGGYATCGSGTVTGSTIINGAGGAAAPVLRISGSGVRDFRNLTIRGGDSTGNDFGGGIQFSGSGDLILRNVGITNNASSYGGGIYFNGSGGSAILTIETNTVILNNTAQNSGGGIYINGSARLFMLRDRTTVQGNTAATGNGGGIMVVGPARADIASPGLVNSGAINNNAAVRGGGIAVQANGNGNASLRLFGIDASRPVRLNANRASESGGAIWLKPYSFAGGDRNYSSTCALDTLIDGNKAPEGAAIYADYDPSTFFYDVPSEFDFNPDPAPGFEPCEDGFPESTSSLGRVACATGVNSCNFIANNLAANSANVQTSGAILYSNRSSIKMNGAVVIGNAGGNFVRGNGSNQLRMRANLVVSNALSSDTIRFDGGDFTVLSAIDNTIANNVNGGATHVLRFDSSTGLVMQNNIIWQPGKLTLLYPGGGQHLSSDDIRYNLVSDVTTLPQGPYNIQGDPQFIDPELSNYGLRISSPGLDVSPPIVGDDRGIDGRPRDQQVRPGPPRALVRDVGALERQPSDPYLINGTFDASLRLWTNDFPDYTHWSAQNDGPAGASGSTEMFIPGDQTGVPGGFQVASIYGVKQCFRVPWPGAYTLSARGFSRADLSVAYPDTPAVNWRLRYNSVGCTGPIDFEGDVTLPRNAGWNSLPAAALITIPEANWNFQTTLEISLGVLQNFSDPAIQNSLFARLDNIVLRYLDDGDLIFRNGFENSP